MKNNKGFLSEESMLGCFVLFVFAVLLFPLLLPFGWSQGYGSHTGFVTAVDLRGNVWKNYDVFFKTDNQSSQEDTYCIPRDNPVLAQQLLEESKNRTLITINYHRMWYFNTWGKCGGDIVDSFEEIKR